MERRIPDWLISMINAEFKTSQSHLEDEKGYFCVDCGGGSLTRREKVEEHGGHRVLQPYKNSNYYCYKRDDIVSLNSDILDVSDIRVFYINKKNVLFPKSRKGEKACAENKKTARPCFNCGYIIDKPALFCSILCKLSIKDVELSKNLFLKAEEEVINEVEKIQYTKNLEEEEKVKMQDLSSEFDEDGKNLNKEVRCRKRRRKGIPRRAPFF